MIKPADSTTDLVIFGSTIAPALKIARRFVGEEPTCAVTNGYNETMAYLLPGMGVAVEVIPRKETAGVAISASRVRKALEEGDAETIRTLVPEVTFRYLSETGRLRTTVRGGGPSDG